MKNRKNAEEMTPFLAGTVLVGIIVFVIKTVLELLF